LEKNKTDQMSGEWSCEVCTFRHAFHGTRCSMCNSLRVTKQQMRDFVAGGGSVGKDNKQTGDQRNQLDLSRTTQDFMTGQTERCEYKNGLSGSVKQMGGSITNEAPVRTSLPIVVNPYRKSNKVDTTVKRNHDGDSITKCPADINKDAEQRDRMKLPNDESTHMTKISPYSNHANSVIGDTTRIINPYIKAHPSVSTEHPPKSSTPASNPLFSSSSSNIENSLSRQNEIPQTIPQGRSNDKEHHVETNRVINQVSLQNSSKKRRRNPESQSHTTQKTTLGYLLGRDSANVTATKQNHVLRGYSPGPVPLAERDAYKTWIYPMSDKYAERKYQLEIARSAILHNTLVSLPTGLGKTLIAAVVMYNFYRWFPKGKVIFLAPTRPLVRQQIEACYNIMGIPEKDTAEISGTIKDRENLWRSRRVFFCTPQAFQRDMENGLCDAKMIVCLVLDEAHKTTKKYAYNIVLQRLRDAGAKARIVGLSATPGRDLKGIQEVIENLGVSKIEARVDTDPEVKPYVHDRSYEVIKVEPCTAEVTVANLLNKVLNPLIDMLRERNGLHLFRGPNSSLTSYNILLEQQQRKQQNDFSLFQQYSVVQALLSAREALNQNGILMARNKLSGFMEKFGSKGGFASRVLQSETFLNLWKTIVKLQDTGKSFSQDDIDDLKLHNPKLEKLEFILKEHFERARACNESSRAIVFSQLRDSVEEIVGVLSGLAPLVLATKFVGQGSGTFVEDISTPNTKRTRSTKVAGMNQKEQQRVIREFRDGKFNVLVCTCIGEEGLDIGQVDLIVNFDCLRSPIRMIQRTGRTGRKRDGRVVCLVSRGKEEQRLQKSEADTRQLWNALKNPRAFTLAKDTPLLPVHPILTRKDMNVARSYRLSQIGGHGQRSVRRKNSEIMDLGTWKLSTEEENTRFENFGRCSLSRSIVKESIKAWQNCVPSRRQELCNAYGFGLSCSVLRNLEISIIADGKEYNMDRSSFEKAKTLHNSLSKVPHHEYRFTTVESHTSSQDSDIEGTTEFHPDNSQLMLDEESSKNYRSGHPLESSTGEDTQTNDNRGSNRHPDEQPYHRVKQLDVEFDPSLNCVERRFSAREINIIWGETDERCHVEAPRNTGVCRWFMLTDDDRMKEVLYPMVPKGNIVCSPKSTVSKSPLQNEDENVVPSLDLSFDQKNKDIYDQSIDSLGGNGELIQPNTSCNIICNADRSDQTKTLEDVNDAQVFMEAKNPCMLESKEESCEMNEEPNSSTKNSYFDDVTSSPFKFKQERSTDEESSVYFDLATPESSSSSDESENFEAIEIVSGAQINRSNERVTFDLTETRNLGEEVILSQELNHVAPSQDDRQLSNNEVEKQLSLTDALSGSYQSNVSQLNFNNTVNEMKESIAHGQRLNHATPVVEMAVKNKLHRTNTPNFSQDDSPIFNKSKSRKTTVDPFLTQFSPSPPSTNYPNVPKALSKRKSTSGLYDTPDSNHIDKRTVQCLEDTPQETPSVSSKQVNFTIPSEERQRSKKQKVDKLVNRRKRGNAPCKYLDIEAEVEGDDSEDDDEAECGLSHDSFINDTSQLGYTQDNLDIIDHDLDLSQNSAVNAASVTIHRQVDMMKERENAFATPTLRRNNNRMNTQSSLPSSEKRLGQMHFIRSVIEHHRQGGDADELERGYHEILKSSGIPCTQDSACLVEQRATSSSVPASKSEKSAPTLKSEKRPKLTTEQLERIERNKQRAIMIRKQRMNQL